MYPKTPITFINLLMVLIVILAVRLGIQTIARSAEIFLFFFVIIYDPSCEYITSNPIC